MWMDETTGRPKVMHGDETRQEKKNHTDVSCTRDGTEIRDFQRKPNSEEFVSGHNHQDPDVRVAENVDEKVKNLTRHGVGNDERGKVNEILRNQNQRIENTERKHEERRRCSTHVTTSKGSKWEKIVDQGNRKNNQR